MKYILIGVLVLIAVVCIFYVMYKNNNETEKDYFQAEEESYTAVIVEPRKHRALSFVLNSFLTNLSDKWNIIIFHGNINEQFVKNIINEEMPRFKKRITLENLGVDNLSITQYNELLTSESFYKKIPTEIMLIFQTDTMINDKNKEKIDEFMKYDYVGAPWASSKEIGNGGLSLRKKSKIIKKLRECKYGGENEDLYFSDDKCVKFKKPDYEKAKEFSVEQVYYDRPFGVHKPNGNLSNDDLNRLKQNINGLDTLIQLQ